MGRYGNDDDLSYTDREGQLPMIAKEGWLAKMGRSGGGWKWRYFKINRVNQTVDYFNGNYKKRTVSNLKGTAQLVGARVAIIPEHRLIFHQNHKYHYQFILRTKDRDFFLCAPTDEEMRTWKMILEKVANPGAPRNDSYGGGGGGGVGNPAVSRVRTSRNRSATDGILPSQQRDDSDSDDDEDSIALKKGATSVVDALFGGGGDPGSDEESDEDDDGAAKPTGLAKPKEANEQAKGRRRAFTGNRSSADLSNVSISSATGGSPLAASAKAGGGGGDDLFDLSFDGPVANASFTATTSTTSPAPAGSFNPFAPQASALSKQPHLAHLARGRSNTAPQQQNMFASPPQQQQMQGGGSQEPVFQMSAQQALGPVPVPAGLSPSMSSNMAQLSMKQQSQLQQGMYMSAANSPFMGAQAGGGGMMGQAPAFNLNAPMQQQQQSASPLQMQAMRNNMPPQSSPLQQSQRRDSLVAQQNASSLL